jgi:voltage-gated potassium channel
MATPPPTAPVRPAPNTRSSSAAWLQRYEAAADPLMAALGVNFLLLLVIDFSDLPLTPDEETWVRTANLVIYGFLIVDALIRLALTPRRREWLRDNALLVVALTLPLVLPFERRLTTPVSILVRLAGLTWGGMRGLSALRTVSRGQVFYFLVLLTTFVTLIGAAVVLALEHGQPETQITAYGVSLWWAATLITTVNSGLDPVSPWGRVVAVAMRIYAVGFFSYLTANLASLLVAHFKSRESGDRR